MRATLMRPVSRLKVYLSKLTAIMAVAGIYLLALLLVTTLLSLLSGSRIENFFMSFGAYLLDAIPLTIVVLMAALLNQFTKSGTLALMMSLLVYFALCVLGIFYPQVSGLLFTGYAQWHNLFFGKIIPIGAMLSKIGLLAGYAIVCFFSGYYFFDRKDI